MPSGTLRLTREEADRFWADPDTERHPSVTILLGCYEPTSEAEFRQSLHDWTDWDFAAYHLGLRLGLYPADLTFRADLKWVFWVANPIGTSLHEMLEAMAQVGWLEVRDEPDIQFRVPHPA